MIAASRDCEALVGRHEWHVERFGESEVDAVVGGMPSACAI